MTLINGIGSAGVLSILLAYFLSSTNRLSPKSLAYILMNLIGAAMACLASMLIAYWPFVVLEGAWTLVSAGALWGYLRPTTRSTT